MGKTVGSRRTIFLGGRESFLSPFVSGERLAEWLPGNSVDDPDKGVRISFVANKLKIVAPKSESSRVCSSESEYGAIKMESEERDVTKFRLVARGNSACVAPDDELLLFSINTQNGDIEMCIPKASDGSGNDLCVYASVSK